MTKVNNYLKQFLNVYWLRPESALWRTMDCIKMEGIEFEKPIIDVGCGDGIFSFLRTGGKFGLDFDMFLSVGNLDKFFKNADIYNSFDRKKVIPSIIQKPKYRIDVGLDWKQTLLDKAGTLGFYDKLIKYDANYKIPLENDSFNTVFSNIVYWLDNVEGVLKEFSRIVTDEGKIVLLLPDKSIKNCYVYNYYLKNKSSWAKLLDGGRYKQMKKCYSYREWEQIFIKSNLEIAFHDTHLSERLIKLWDIGLRPLSPVLIEMSNKLEGMNRKRIKKEWIKICFNICKSFLEEELGRSDNVFHLFVLEKKKSM